MQQELLDKLRRITEEEQLILQGASDIQSDLYTTQFAKPSDFTVDSKKLLEKGCLIESPSSIHGLYTFQSTGTTMWN